MSYPIPAIKPKLVELMHAQHVQAEPPFNVARALGNYKRSIHVPGQKTSAVLVQSAAQRFSQDSELLKNSYSRIPEGPQKKEIRARLIKAEALSRGSEQVRRDADLLARLRDLSDLSDIAEGTWLRQLRKLIE